MIEVTQNAARQLRTLLDAQKQSAGKGLRVQIMKGGCSGLHYEMTLDEKKTGDAVVDRKSTRLNSSHSQISYAVFCLKKKKKAFAARTTDLSTHLRPITTTVKIR